ncbi:MAG: hypothetical protein FJ265_21055, partial [Planctomycetes bacterium]|nr:hypothetical protein [Planctomycetota bacterium]
MTQVDLPQVSVQRYLELLRRRRWQVIPVSLLGLVIGGLVAFFIPRYYVAQSVLTYESPPGASVARGDEDPFLVIVDTARLTLPNAIESAVKTLGWEQAAIADPFERTQALRQLEGRLEVGDANPGKGRKHARIVVTYRDRDGLRSADFVNTLVGTWMQQRLADLRAGAEQDKATATARYNELQAAYNQYLDRRSTLERTYGIDPALDLGWQKVAFDRREADLQQRRAELAALRKAIVAAQQRLAQLQERRNLLPARVQVGTELSLEELAKLPAAQKLLLELDYYQKLVEAYRPGNPWRRAAEGRVAEIKLDLAKVASP